MMRFLAWWLEWCSRHLTAFLVTLVAVSTFDLLAFASPALVTAAVLGALVGLVIGVLAAW